MILKWKLVGIVLAVLALVSGCGLGTVGIAAGAGNSGGGGSAPTLTAFEVVNPKVSPATLRLDASQPVLVELFYARPGVATTAMMELSGPGVSGNQVQLPSGATDLAWNFEAELGGPEFVADVDLFARHPNGASISGGSLRLGMGNDPPVMLRVDPMPTDPSNPDESSGNVEVRLGVRDSSADVVAILVEWRRASDTPDAWEPATAAGVFPSGVETTTTGVELSFFWNTNVDLADGDDDVFLRAIADDGTLDTNNNPIGVSAPLESALLHIDNNAEPRATLHDSVLVANPDRRRGIPVPFHVEDEEGDEVQLVLQWRRPGEAFPALPSTPALIQAALNDPEQRRELQICSEYPRVAAGRGFPIDATTVELPELASSGSWVLAHGIVGQQLEILRASKQPKSVASTWTTDPLLSPVAVLPIGAGLRALAVDQPSAGSWRVIEVELATGRVVRELAVGAGSPRTATWERGDGSILVASDLPSGWHIDSVDYETGAVTALISEVEVGYPGELRGLASLGRNAALATLGDGLVRLDWTEVAMPRAATVLAGLATPWGIAVDPLRPGRAYVAEHDAPGPQAGRVISVDWSTHGVEPIVAAAAGGGPPLPAPRDLALARHGSRLLALCDVAPGSSELRAVDVGAAAPNQVFSASAELGGDARSLATGAEDLVILIGGEGLLVGGGIEQERTIVEHAVDRRRVQVAEAFEPPIQPNATWRLPYERGSRFQADGGRDVFLWDSSDVLGGEALLRATPVDAEIGSPGESLTPKRVRAPFDGRRTPLPVGTPFAFATSDIDADGAVDIVAGSLSDDVLLVYWQTHSGEFDETPAIVGSPQVTDQPLWVQAADLDADGDLDLVSSVVGGLVIFRQTAPRTFDPVPETLNSGGGSGSIADVDGDGRLDLVASAGSKLVVFWQTGSGSFDPEPTEVGDSLASAFLVQAVDMDSDGQLDLVSADNGSLSIFWQTSPRVFDSVPTVPSTYPTINTPQSMQAADMDGDGDLDLVALNLSSPSGPGAAVSVSWQTSPRAFDPDALILPVGTGYFAQPADMDGDEDLDLVVSGESTVFLYHQTSAGSFDPIPTMVVEELGAGLFGMEASDLDGDGYLDIAVADWFGNTLTVVRHEGTRALDPAPSVLAGSTALPDAEHVQASDLDGDSDLDLIVTSTTGQSTGKLAIFWQLSEGNFLAAPTEVGGFPTLNQPKCVRAADLDGDGRVDLASTSYQGDALAMFWQTSSGEFSPTPTLVHARAPHALQVVDVDRDGMSDLVSGVGDPLGLRVHWQTSARVFDPTPTALEGIGTVNHPDSVQVADLDSDGQFDLVCAGRATDALDVFWQSEPRVFEGPTMLNGSLPSVLPNSLDVADLDCDGDIDVVSANAFSLTVFWQTAPRTFDPMPTILPNMDGNFHAFVLASDVDGDGDPDLVSGNVNGPDFLRVFRQTGGGRFDPTPRGLGDFGAEGPWAAHAIDVDGDGDLDLASSNFSGPALTVFWGAH